MSKEMEDLMNDLDPHKNNEVEQISSDDEPLPPPVNDKKDERNNIIYHDSNSELGLEDRYVSENKEIGRDVKGYNTTRNADHSPKGAIINKTFKFRPSVMTVFPSYGVKGSHNPFETTNQLNEVRKVGVEVDMPDRSYFRQVYNMKTYMEEMLKAKNMRGEKK